MNIINILLRFWHGNLSLWKSYWIFGELINSFIILAIYNIEVRYYNNDELIKQLPFLNFHNFNFLSKSLFLIWSIYVTVGIWRSAEKYKGKFIWILLVLIIMSYRIFTLRLIFF